MNKKKIILIAVAVVAVAGISIRLFGGSTAKHKVTYETATVIKGEISESITATGTIEPVTEVEVGTQVSGIIDKIYADYNSVVTKGQLIAEMDRVTLQSEVASQRAAYNGAKAEYEYQRKNYERNRGLRAVRLQLRESEKQLRKQSGIAGKSGAQPVVRHHHFAHRRRGHQPCGRGRANGGIRFRDSYPVHHRCRPDADAGCGRRG